MRERKPKYQILPALTPAEYDALKASIRKRGVEVPIIVDQCGEIVDGFHRQKACDELGISCPTEVRRFDSEAERLELAVTANCQRRQLSRKQKRALIAAYLRRDPAIADNALAGLIGVSNNTVSSVRTELEATLQIAKLTQLRGRDGKIRRRKYARVLANIPAEVELALEVVNELPRNGKTFDVMTAARRLRRQRQRTIRQQEVVQRLPDDSVRLYHCPFQELEQVAGLVPNSVDFFYADIPFDGSFLPQLADLAALAARVLRDGGICAIQSGQWALNHVMTALSERLTYRWMMATVWDGPANIIHRLSLASQWRPKLLFSKGDWSVPGLWPDLSHHAVAEKEWHPWQQPLAEVEALVRYFTKAGDLVLDACGGSFTTAVACRNLGRRCISCDVDERAVAIGHERLSAEAAFVDEQSRDDALCATR